jgi:hypothetical protein
VTPKAFRVDDLPERSNLIPFHAPQSQETFPGRDTNDKETSARSETQTATAFGFTAT